MCGDVVSTVRWLGECGDGTLPSGDMCQHLLLTPNTETQWHTGPVLALTCFHAMSAAAQPTYRNTNRPSLRLICEVRSPSRLRLCKPASECKAPCMHVHNTLMYTPTSSRAHVAHTPTFIDLNMRKCSVTHTHAHTHPHIIHIQTHLSLSSLSNSPTRSLSSPLSLSTSIRTRKHIHTSPLLHVQARQL